MWAPSSPFHPAAEIRDHCTVRTTSTVPTFLSTTIIHRRTNGVVDREFRSFFPRICTRTVTRLNFSCQTNSSILAKFDLANFTFVCRQSSPWPPISKSRPRRGNSWRSAVWSSSAQDHTPASWPPLLRLSTTSGYVESHLNGLKTIRRIMDSSTNGDDCRCSLTALLLKKRRLSLATPSPCLTLLSPPSSSPDFLAPPALAPFASSGRRRRLTASSPPAAGPRRMLRLSDERT